MLKRILMGIRKSKSLRLRGLSFSICAGVTILLTGVLLSESWKASNIQKDAQRRETHIREVIQATAETLSALQDAEIGERGYLLTMQPDYLVPYYAGVQKLDELIKRLDVLIDCPTGQTRIKELRRIATDKLAILSETVSLTQRGNQAGAIALTMTGRGKSLMDDARQTIEKMRMEENVLLADQQAATADAVEQDQSIGLALGAVGMVAMLLAIVAIIWLLISRHARLNLEIRVAQELQAHEETHMRLVRSEKLNALGQLAGGIAHDFNNILQAVSGSAGVMIRHAGNPSKVAKFGAIIEDVAMRGASITNRLLIFARQGHLHTEAFDVPVMLEGLHELLTHTMNAFISIKLDVEESLPPLLADKGQLETVLVNLVTNARDAMPKGGTITISAALDVIQPGVCNLGLTDGTYIKLSVEDNGIGMDRDILNHVTEPFFTTKPVGQGTGLGLSMAKGFAEQSGGILTILSEVGHGTTVTLWLPIKEPLLLVDTKPSELQQSLLKYEMA